MGPEVVVLDLQIGVDHRLFQLLEAHPPIAARVDVLEHVRSQRLAAAQPMSEPDMTQRMHAEDQRTTHASTATTQQTRRVK